jgi:hypothetical protein
VTKTLWLACAGTMAIACMNEVAAAQSAPNPPPSNVPEVAPAVQPQGQRRPGGGPKQSPVSPEDPYPIQTAGWGRAAGPTFFYSRWVEDWSKLKDAGKAPPLKARPLIGDDVTLTLSSELRVRVDAYNDAALFKGDDFHQSELRVIAGADLRLGEHFRVYGELADAQVDGKGFPYTPNFRGNAAPGNYRNDLAVQQLFGEARTNVGGYLIGAMAGRMEFTDGPSQIIAVSDGPNLHRTWNGVRLYLHGSRLRLGLVDLKPTLLGLGAFDEHTDHSQHLRAVTGSVMVVKNAAGSLFLEPFYFNTRMNRGSAGANVGLDKRDTWGARLRGKQGPLTIDWNAIRQTGDHVGRDIDAWAASLTQDVLVGKSRLQPRVGAHIDLGSGGNTYGSSGPIRSFNQLYASSNYLGQGLLLSQSNLVLIAPMLAINPVKRVTLNLDYAYLRRMRADDAVYGGLMRPYAGTERVQGHTVGTYARVVASWAATPNITVDAEAERLFAGQVLRRAGYGSGTYGMLSLTYRY